MPPKSPSKKTAKTTRTPAPKAAPLRSAALPRKDLIDIGARYNLASLTDHASAVLSKIEAQNDDAEATEHFADYGFNAGWVSAIQGLLAEVEQSGDAASDVASSALPTAAALQAAFTAVKDLRRQGVTVLAADPARTSAMGELGTGASVPATRRALAKVATLVPATAVTPSGSGKDFRAKAKVALKALDVAEKAHRAAVAKLSPAAIRVHATKGILQQELKSVARVARSVSPSDSALYAIDSHTRVRTPSRKRPAKTNGSATTSTTATSGASAAKA